MGETVSAGRQRGRDLLMQTRHGQPASREADSGRWIRVREQITEHYCIQGWSDIVK